jgi:hypothetical protein
MNETAVITYFKHTMELIKEAGEDRRNSMLASPAAAHRGGFLLKDLRGERHA